MNWGYSDMGLLDKAAKSRQGPSQGLLALSEKKKPLPR